jgi:hypothetical protein
MVSVNSSNLRAVGFDEWTGTLTVKFHSGSVYEHYDVPAWKHSGLMGAASKGGYYAAYLRNRHGCRRVR